MTKLLRLVGILFLISFWGCGDEQAPQPVKQDEQARQSVEPADPIIGTWIPIGGSVLLSEDQKRELRQEYEQRLIETQDLTWEAWLKEQNLTLGGNRLSFTSPELTEQMQLQFFPAGDFQLIIKGNAEIIERGNAKTVSGVTLGLFASGRYTQTENGLNLRLINVKYKLPEVIEGNNDFEEQIRRSGALEDNRDIKEFKVAFRLMFTKDSGLMQYTFNADQTQLTTVNDAGFEWIWQREE
ncbi:MAG: hypothetical protein O7E52_14575 [Candidatus Poribacteria bacterium]|nr:hypothetical protein [Candidatus Poribacteria bacterium]